MSDFSSVEDAFSPLLILKLRMLNRNPFLSESNTFWPQGKAHVLKFCEVYPRDTCSTSKECKEWQSVCFFFGGGKKVYSFMLLFRSVDESCKLKKILMNYVNFFLFCFFFFFFLSFSVFSDFCNDF